MAMSFGPASRLHDDGHRHLADGDPMNVTITRGASRGANAGLWMLQVLLAAVYAFSAFGKLAADPRNVAGFEAMGLGITGMYLIGGLELAGAVAMFVPPLTGLAALCFVGLMVGAVTITWIMFGTSWLVAVPAVVGVIAAVVAWGRRDTIRRLFTRPHG
jgi:uncharacterized membrane protein YphA (DoxX/SURF4 family)